MPWPAQVDHHTQILLNIVQWRDWENSGHHGLEIRTYSTAII